MEKKLASPQTPQSPQAPQTQTTQAQQTQQFPSEEVTLPSKGLLYPESSPLRSGMVRMKYMTAKEEDILTNQNYIKNGTVIDRLLQSLIIDDVKVDELLIGDKNAMLVAARILGYGSDYNFKYIHPETGEEEEVSVDLTEAEDKYFDEALLADGTNDFEFELPTSKIVITFKLLTTADDKSLKVITILDVGNSNSKSFVPSANKASSKYLSSASVKSTDTSSSSPVSGCIYLKL
jgi:hypothetical protein